MIPPEELAQFEEEHPCKIVIVGETTKVYVPPGRMDPQPIVAFLAAHGITNGIWWIGPGAPSSPFHVSPGVPSW